MKIRDLTTLGYERVLLAEDEPSGLKAMIAIHSTALGPACGGIRLRPYSSLMEAQEDVLRLSRGMSYKSALAGLKFGGGKSVIIHEPSKKSTELFHAFGDFVESLSGRYIAAKDMNISGEDLAEVRRRTHHVLGIEGASGSGGDPSPLTARGVVRAMEASAEYVWGGPSLSGVKVVIQGVGQVGYCVARYLKEKNAEVIISDSSRPALERCARDLGVRSLALEQVFEFPCDIFSPCALGGVLNSRNIEKLKCRAVVGAANNQLATPADGIILHEKGILFAPDYVANAGGIINIYVEYEGYDFERAVKKTDAIYQTLQTIYQRAQKSKRPPFVIADEWAEDCFNGKS